MNLLIVESPAKCKTIKKFLGDTFEVLASYGHIRDLSDKHTFGVDINNKFQPHFIVVPGKSKYITELKNALKNATTVYLATDDDREGEAIAWHLAEILKLDPLTNPRITFREITKKAITTALEKPGVIDMNVVHSQQARQVLDKLVGFELSPLLWKHISSGLNLSAGRVQSVVTKLVIDREKEIKSFICKSFYKVDGEFTLLGDQQVIFAELDKKLETKDDSQVLLEKCISADFKISDLQTKEELRYPKAPFITSTLQQEAGARLGFTTKQTMTVAQKLYEKGYITYMRTDSTSISKDFQEEIKKYVVKTYGIDYLNIKHWDKKIKGSQDAHECIRPTDVNRIWLETGEHQEKKLYRIIWQRTVASQMTPQKLEVLTVKIGIFLKDGDEMSEKFKSKFEKELFPGFKVIYSIKLNDDNDGDDVNGVEDGSLLMTNKVYDDFAKRLKIGDQLRNLNVTAVEKYTEPSSRYSEATLVKTLESNGIGRPSTYASIISKIQEKNYIVKETREGAIYETCILKIGSDSGNGGSGGKKVVKEVKNGVTCYVDSWKSRTEKNKLFPTDIGLVVTDFLNQHFDKIMDYDFTSKMEEKLDIIASGNAVWHHVVKEYYDIFHPRVMLLENAKTSGVLGDAGSVAKNKHTRLLGVHPVSGMNVYVTLARYGPCLRIGDNPKKADYYNIGKGVAMTDITLEEALKACEYPKNLGESDGVAIYIKKGPYGFYLERGKERVTIQKDVNPEEIDLEIALKMIAEKGNPSYILGTFNDGSDVIKIMKGKFGPYIKKGGTNVPVKGLSEDQIKMLNLAQVKEMINNYLINPKKRGPKKKKSDGEVPIVKKKISVIKKKPVIAKKGDVS